MKPRYTITIVDNFKQKELTFGVDDFSEFKQKTLTGKSAIYEQLDRFEEDVVKTDSTTE